MSVQSAEPKKIGRYLLYSSIATGGMARVHLARLIGGAGFARTVAIKRLHPHLAEDPEFAGDLIDPPEVLGVEQITVDGAVVRTTIKTASESQWRIGRELRRRLTEALETAGITQHITASRVFVRPPTQPGTSSGQSDHGVAGAT